MKIRIRHLLEGEIAEWIVKLIDSNAYTIAIGLQEH